VERLETRGWIRSKEMETSGGRRSREYGLTARGRKVLRGWLGPPLSLSTVAIPSDPLRTRIEFLYSLPPPERKHFLTDAIRQIREQIQIIQKDLTRRRKEGNVPAYAAGLGALKMMRARLEWLHQAGRILVSKQR
jgi:DNA-binding PadR family transcriptional regulator